jgi:3'(2'), 5'-bisphosphate nucleotidase
MNAVIDFEPILKLSVLAGKAILSVYNDPEEDFDISVKADSSPLTKADKIAHKIIAEGLQSLYPEIPLISEEGRNIPFEERSGWTRFWCVDPLDGTKEFIKRNGEFTVNIALIEQGYLCLVSFMLRSRISFTLAIKIAGAGNSYLGKRQWRSLQK